MKKLMLLCLIGGLAFGISIFPMDMDTSDDAQASCILVSLTLPEIDEPLRNGMVKKYGVLSKEGMYKILSAMSKKERDEFYLACCREERMRQIKLLIPDYTSEGRDDSNSEDTESDVEISDKDDVKMSDKESKPKLKPKDERRSKVSSEAPGIKSYNVIIASCTQCSAKLFENRTSEKPHPLSGQQIFYSRQEGRCPGYPTCIHYHDAAEKYRKCAYCPWLFKIDKATNGVTQHMNQKHRWLPHKIEKPVISVVG